MPFNLSRICISLVDPFWVPFQTRILQKMVLIGTQECKTNWAEQIHASMSSLGVTGGPDIKRDVFVVIGPQHGGNRVIYVWR